ncbi:craniofacial development protein 2-like [Elysia marginata]|uniref:Craniofacial development protein 2-like n=1 Tax=Elysia marginata TaxID=1093978 RepID=A0AAV4ICZ2_9GAST|nr:craniofacial development protein 2-like [Elysia marginata]
MECVGVHMNTVCSHWFGKAGRSGRTIGELHQSASVNVFCPAVLPPPPTSQLAHMELSEVRWKVAGKITSGKHEFIYSGGLESERGVGIVLDQNVRKAVKVYWALSDRVLLVKIAGKPLDLNIIYAPTTCSSEEDIEEDIEKFL